jgi:phosphotransferase system IIB component
MLFQTLSAATTGLFVLVVVTIIQVRCPLQIQVVFGVETEQLKEEIVVLLLQISRLNHTAYII